MAIKQTIKKAEPTIKKDEVEKKIVEAIDQVAEDQTPFMKQEANGELTVMGDPKLIDTKNEEVYDVTLVLPKPQYNPEDFEKILKEDDNWFMVEVQATQEPVTPFNRTYLAAVAVDFIVMFFEDDGNGNLDLMSLEKREKQTIKFFRTDEIVENTKFFVGKLLGIDTEMIPYLWDVDTVGLAIQLIVANPSLINEAYFTVK